MKKEEIFCDLCKRHVPSEFHGAVFGMFPTDKGTEFAAQRNFNRVADNDICLCNSCLYQIKETNYDPIKNEKYVRGVDNTPRDILRRIKDD